MRLSLYLRSAEVILGLYDGSLPFSSWLKNYFREHKKFGSKDRKAIARICFAYFRTGKALADMPLHEQLLAAMIFIHPDEPQLTDLIKPEWKELLYFSKNSAIDFLLHPSQIFPLNEELSAEVNEPAFWLSHLQMPDLFLRIRPGKKEIVLRKLEKSGIAFSRENDCLQLSNGTQVEEVLTIDEEAVVQDKSSQKVLDDLHLHLKNWKHQTFSAWDCCAASGGKTILLHDLFPKAQLTVSDIRDSILHNLRNRFKRAGISNYQSFVADISSPLFSVQKQYDVIICDAPCSGSGTWGRTPEQLKFFQPEKIDFYAALQKRIAANAATCLQQGGFFVYITCSVFAKENEEVVEYLKQNTALQLVSKQYVKGYTEKADTLFSALFTL